MVGNGNTTTDQPAHGEAAQKHSITALTPSQLTTPTTAMLIQSIQAGTARQFVNDETGKTWTSAIIKSPVPGPVWVSKTGLTGDQQADTKHHGGHDKAVLSYPAIHYHHWATEFPEIPWGGGAFGENLTLAEISDEEGSTRDATPGRDVCIGDVFAAGECLLQISQPREPCWKLSSRWQLPKLAVRVQEKRMTGWYLRVLQEGEISPGQTMVLTQRLHPEFTIDHANEIMFAQPRRRVEEQHLAACPELSDSWKETLRR